MVKNSGGKGFEAEESLRTYFRNTGYFVVRGIPLIYRGCDVTDVDLWLYVKATSLAAERACVDIKRKRTPQAMERVLWTKGLKEVLGVDRAIVVTSDNRAETREFGIAHGVSILQGNFLQRVLGSCAAPDRLTEEDMWSLLKMPCVVDASVEWRGWLRGIKAKLLDSLNFDGCNSFLLAAKHLLDEYVATGKGSEVPVRLLYVTMGYLLVCLDFTSRSFVPLDLNARASAITDGFRYGESGRRRTEEIVRMALHFLTESGKDGLFSGQEMQGEFQRQMSEYKAEILGEHFAKPDALKNLFALARGFEELAYSKTLLRPHEVAVEQKAVIGLICDLLGHDRKAII